jgi:hypothetical protein
MPATSSPGRGSAILAVRSGCWRDIAAAIIETPTGDERHQRSGGHQLAALLRLRQLVRQCLDPPGGLHEALFELQFARGLAAILSQGERLAQVGKLDIQVVFSIRRDSFLTRHL